MTGARGSTKTPVTENVSATVTFSHDMNATTVIAIYCVNDNLVWETTVSLAAPESVLQQDINQNGQTCYLQAGLKIWTVFLQDNGKIAKQEVFLTGRVEDVDIDGLVIGTDVR